MRDPDRLRQSPATDPEVRELLQSLREIQPQAGSGMRSWGAMALRLATVPAVVPPLDSAPLATAQAPVASSAALGAGVSHAIGVKLAVATLVPVLLGGGAYWFHAAHRAGAAEPSAVAAALIVAPPVKAPAHAADEVEGAVEEEAMAAPIKSAPRFAGSASRASRLEAEASMLAKVRSELRNGNAEGALVALNQLRARFPNGALGQEREVLAIEVLAANGDTARARRKASAFIATHPASPYSAKVKRFVEAP
jgi:hypothetical protein